MTYLGECSDTVGDFYKLQSRPMCGFNICTTLTDFEEFEKQIKNVNKMKEFKKEDLKTGMRVEFKNGMTKIVKVSSHDLDSGVFTNSKGRHMSFCDYKENLLVKNSISDEFSIIKIWDIPYDNYEFFNITIKGDLLFERKEEKPIVILDGIEYSESTLRSIIEAAHKK